MVAFDAGDLCDELHSVGVALAEDRVLAVELRYGDFGDEELGAVGASARWAWAGVGHGKATGLVEADGWVDLVLEEITGIAGSGALPVPALDHEARDNAVEGGGVVIGLAADFFESVGVGPVFGAFSEADEVGDSNGGLLVVELAGEAAHGGINDGGGAGGDGGWPKSAGRSGRVGKIVGRSCRRGVD